MHSSAWLPDWNIVIPALLAECGEGLAEIITKLGGEAALEAKEAANENDETRKRFEVMHREIFQRHRTCLTMTGVKDHPTVPSLLYGETATPVPGAS